MLPHLVSFLWRVGLLGIILSETSWVTTKVRGSLARKMLQFTQLLGFWTTVLLTVCYVDSSVGLLISPCNLNELKVVFTPALCILAVVGFVVAIGVNVSSRRPVKATASVATRDEKPTWNENANWDEIKAAWMAWHAPRRDNETPRGRAFRTWAGTLALCAAVCLMSVCIEVEADQPISIPRVMSGFRRTHVPPAAKRAVPNGGTSNRNGLSSGRTQR
jgi:hypothetical protein